MLCSLVDLCLPMVEDRVLPIVVLLVVTSAIDHGLPGGCLVLLTREPNVSDTDGPPLRDGPPGSHGNPSLLMATPAERWRKRAGAQVETPRNGLADKSIG